MTLMLQQALAEVQKLSASQQDTIAAIILEEIAEDRRWETAFAQSKDKLTSLATKVREDRARREEVEQDRLQQAGELAAESGEGWADEFLPGTCGCHELLDRTALMADMVGRYILDHPACVANPAWYRLAERAVAALNDLYQQVGAVHMSSDAPV